MGYRSTRGRPQSIAKLRREGTCSSIAPDLGQSRRRRKRVRLVPARKIRAARRSGWRRWGPRRDGLPTGEIEPDQPPASFTTRFKAEGGPGRSQQRHGKNGKDLFVDVPVGTVVWDDESGEILADLTEDDERTAVARGGRGGLGNVHFKTSTRRRRLGSPSSAPSGKRSRFELRMIADVGLVGLPTRRQVDPAGRVVSSQTEDRGLPFTTLEPILGVVQVGGVDGQIFVMADIPGLIGGAAQGVGLGLNSCAMCGAPRSWCTCLTPPVVSKGAIHCKTLKR